MSNIRNHRKHGVYIEFDNGNDISTVWGVGSYGSNYYYPRGSHQLGWDSIPDNEPAATVEVLFNCGEKLSKRLHRKFDGDGSVIGYLTVDQWLYIVNALNSESRPTKDGQESHV